MTEGDEADADGDAAADDAGGTGHSVVLRSSERGDDVRASRIGHDAASGERNSWRCSAPCTLRLESGHYRLRWSAAGVEEEIDLASDMLIEGHGGNTAEVIVGIGALVVSGVIFSVALLTGEGACFELDAKQCSLGNGPLALGVGTFGVLFGLFLMFDSSGYVELTSF
jgi:hypothetical protein